MENSKGKGQGKGKRIVTGKTWAQARELERRVRALLFPNRLKRREREREIFEMVEEKKELQKKQSFYKGTVLGNDEEVMYAGRVVQVGEAHFSLKPGQICFLHRFQGKLGGAEVGFGQTLGNWH